MRARLEDDMRTTLTTLILGIGGCGSQIGTETDGCKVTSTEAVHDLAATPEGFTEPVQAMIDRLVGTFEGTLTHPDGTTPLTLTVARDGDPVVERLAWEQPASGIEIGGDCQDAVRIPIAVTVDGAPELDEAFDTSAFLRTDGTGAFTSHVDLDDVGGTAAPTQFSADEMARVELDLSAVPVDGGYDGEVGFVGTSHPSGKGPDSTVSATFDTWGTFEVRRPAE